MNKRILCLMLMLSVISCLLCFSVNAESSTSIAGIYEGTYTAPQGLTGVTLYIEKDGNKNTAIFEFYPTEGGPADVESGSFNMSIKKNADIYELKAGSWISKAPTYITLDIKNCTIENGILNGEIYGYRSSFFGIKMDYGYLGEINCNKVSNIKVFLDESELSFDQPPIMIDNRVMVPMRKIFESLNYDVEWIGNEQKAVATKNGNSIIVQINNPQIQYKRGTYTCDVVPTIIEGRTLVPVRAVSECDGCDVSWESENNAVIIKSKVAYKTVAGDIEKNNIKEHINLNMREWTPLKGLTEAMLNTGGLSENNAETIADAFEFVTTWIGNAVEITKLDVTVGNDNTISIKYGESIEKNRSGAEMTLAMMLQEKFYNVNPSILFTQDELADEYIRNWFGLEGEGTYSMVFDFGKIEYGAYGYYLLIEGNNVYQVPIIHPDTTMKVYYKEGKEKKLIMDAAEILRNTKFELSDEEKEKVLDQLWINGYRF